MISFCDKSFADLDKFKSWVKGLAFSTPLGDSIRPQNQCVIEHFQQSIDLDQFEQDHSPLGERITYYVGSGNTLRMRGDNSNKRLDLTYYYGVYEHGKSYHKEENSEGETGTSGPTEEFWS